MNMAGAVEQVRRLSDGELLAGLSGALGANHRWVALVLAHLAEVDERRLHLLAGHTSLFVYCTARLAMSEDEAYRRIRVARVSRRFPIVLDQLANGHISLSVAALVEPHLTAANHRALLSAVSGKTVRQTREVLAAWFPRPDVLPFIRKLPERPNAGASSSGRGLAGGTNERTDAAADADAARARSICEAAASGSMPGEPLMPTALPVEVRGGGPLPANRRSAAEPSATPSPSGPTPIAPAPARRGPAVEPLSPGRYKVQLTVDAELKRKLELASDLLRHALPDGDLAAIVGRALDLLIEKTLRRRFGKTSKGGEGSHASTSCEPNTVAGPSLETARSNGATIPVVVAGSTHATCLDASPRVAETDDDASPVRSHPGAPNAPSSDSRSPAPAPSPSRRLPNAVRRTVLERDGLRCTWLAPDGTRCDSQAWLEHDHIIPRGQGGSDGAANIRIRCRAHNRLAAERAYGQQTINQIIARRRARQRPITPA